MKTKSEILAKITDHYQDLLEGDLLNEIVATPKQCFDAMQQYSEEKNKALRDAMEKIFKESNSVKIQKIAYEALKQTEV